MSEHIEIERRWVFEFDPYQDRPWMEPMPVPVVCTGIIQTYLVPPEGVEGTTERVRVLLEGPQCRYTHTVKRPVEGRPGEAYEDEREVTREEYDQLWLRAFPEHVCRSISKLRMAFTWEGQNFELDVFNEWGYDGMAILEIELPTIDTPVTLPPFLPEMREVTGDKRWSNASPARHGRPKGNGCGACDGKGWVGFSQCHICEGRK